MIATTDFNSKIVELNPPNLPMIDCHYYKWLDENHTKNWHRLTDKSAYLKSIGFVRGSDFITIETIDVLKHIHSHHFRNNI